MGEKWPWILPKVVTSTSLLGSFTCRKFTTWDWRLYFPSEGRCAEDFFARKADGFGRVWTRKLGYQKPARSPLRTPKPLVHYITTLNYITLQYCITLHYYMVLALIQQISEWHICWWSQAAINPLNAELNPNCHLLALLRAHHILHVSWIRVKSVDEKHASYSTSKYKGKGERNTDSHFSNQVVPTEINIKFISFW